MKKFIEDVLRAANQFKAIDFTFFKIYMLSVGVILGAYFASFWMTYINIVWVVAIFAGVFTIFRLLKNFKRDC